jgi:cysteinyl-tRNA synthetase
MGEVAIHDTRTGRLAALEPREPGRVGIYACGPTVYDRIHVGNARPYVVFSLYKRFLVHAGYEVTLVVNITDINDKIYAAAAERGVGSVELAREMTAAYIADTDGLGLGRPDAEPLASETVAGIVELIGTLIEKGHAYEAGGDIYFSVRSFPAYGALSNRKPDDMDQGEEPGRKRDALDFALWKAEKPAEDTAWAAPWGRGRPAWHIECSVMAEEILGLDFEIHGGGTDLIFPHHENEVAQTEAARERPLARIWMHNGMLRLDGEKMAKSVGNVFLLHEALERHGRDALVAYFLEGHYRQPVTYSEARLEEAAARVRGIREAARRLGPGPSPPELAPLRERFFAALADDFNTPRALAVVAEWTREANRRGGGTGDADLREMLDVVGLANLLEADERADDEARRLLELREEARAEHDYAAADRIRDELAALGWQVRDAAHGPELVRAS